MIRQNKDGRPIFKDEVWEQIVRTAQKLRKLGYKESNKKTNLFYKSIEAEVSSERGKVSKVKGSLFADLRGTNIVPIWDDPRPLVYYSEIPFNSFIFECRQLERAGSSSCIQFLTKIFNSINLNSIMTHYGSLLIH